MVMDIGMWVFVLIVLPCFLALIVVSGIKSDRARVDQATESFGFGDDTTINKHLGLECFQKGSALGKRLSDLGYWSIGEDFSHGIFERMVATPEAMYYKIRLKKLSKNATVDKLIGEGLLRELEFMAESRLTTYSNPEHGVWLIAHRPGYEITDASYKPYLDKRKNEAA